VIEGGEPGVDESPGLVLGALVRQLEYDGRLMRELAQRVEGQPDDSQADPLWSMIANHKNRYNRAADQFSGDQQEA
jgi:hypothetical protein